MSLRERLLVFSGLMACFGFALLASQVILGRGLATMDAATVTAAQRMPAATSIGVVTDLVADNLVVLPASLVAALLLWRTRRHAEALVVALLPFGLQAVVHVLKLAFATQRPFEAIVATFSWGFPSGHTANAFLVVGLGAWVAWRVRGRHAAIAVLLVGAPFAFTVALGRLTSGAHYLTDVVGGALIAMALASAAFLVVERAPHVQRSLRLRRVPVQESHDTESLEVDTER